MYKYAQILNNKAHWIFEVNETLEELCQRFAPNITFVDITANPNIKEGWDYDGVQFTDPAIVTDLEEAKRLKLAEFDSAAAKAYVAGFQSSAAGAPMWYDSDPDTQNVINRQYLIALSSPTVYSSTQFFAGVPAGVTPVRAKRYRFDPDKTKAIQLLNAAQMVQLGGDLAVAWATVKATLWSLQGRVNQSASVDEVMGISWPAGD